MHKIRTYNKISPKGLSRFEAGKYTVTDNVSDPDAFILRSQKLHDEEIPPSVKAVARAGAGVNNIPNLLKEELLCSTLRVQTLTQ